MKLPRDLSGQRLVGTLIAKWQYRQVNRVGSHIILQTEEPRHHRLSIPDHASLRYGTLNAILRDVARGKTSATTRSLVRYEFRTVGRNVTFSTAPWLVRQREAARVTVFGMVHCDARGPRTSLAARSSAKPIATQGRTPVLSPETLCRPLRALQKAQPDPQNA